MFDNLKIESELTVTTVAQSLKGNPFTIKAVIGTSDGKFTGASFIEVLRGNEVISAGVMCNDYGIEHLYSGEDADKLTELCKALTEAISERFNVTFLEREEPATFEEPVPPVAEEGESNE